MSTTIVKPFPSSRKFFKQQTTCRVEPTMPVLEPRVKKPLNLKLVALATLLSAVAGSMFLFQDDTTPAAQRDSERLLLLHMEDLEAELRGARVLDEPGPRASLAYQLPQRGPHNTLKLGPTGERIWGGYHGGGFMRGAQNLVCFHPGPKWMKPLHERLLKLDLNGDGDVGDTFHLGQLSIYFQKDGQAPTLVRMLSGSCTVEMRDGAPVPGLFEWRHEPKALLSVRLRYVNRYETHPRVDCVEREWDLSTAAQK